MTHPESATSPGHSLLDLIARTAVVYDWGGRTAQLPDPLTAYLRAHDAVWPRDEHASGHRKRALAR
ncbi:hypothetical protein ACFQ3F_17385 [Nocardioides ginsengisoli]|uniref:Uncharacterized protein n=1 Tax=Nocardioides ginsengisoli TaxID=363868 RepID=A0ABW3W4Z9_9ACTN